MKKQKKLGTAGLADFFRQFSVLVSSGLPVTEGVVWADTENGESEKIRTVVTSFWREDGSELVLHAECTVREQTESASIVLGRERLSVYTPSTADRKEENAP